MRDYGKVHAQFWSSATIRALSEDGRMLALYLLTSPHATLAGVFRLPDGYVCEDMQWTSERVSKGFAELFAKGFANRCETTKWVWVCKHLDWNPPENPNQKKSAAKIAQGVPDECQWKQQFIEALSLLFDDGSVRVSEPFLNQKQEQEQKQKQEQKQEKTKPARAAPAVPMPDGMDLQVWQDFLAQRKKKNAPLTQTALDGIAKEAAKAGISLEDALRTCCKRGWQGFESAWVGGGQAPDYSSLLQGN